MGMLLVTQERITNVSGNCEEELPKKPVGRLSVTCRPTVDRQSVDRFFGELFFTITRKTPHILKSIYQSLDWS